MLYTVIIIQWWPNIILVLVSNDEEKTRLIVKVINKTLSIKGEFGVVCLQMTTEAVDSVSNNGLIFLSYFFLSILSQLCE